MFILAGSITTLLMERQRSQRHGVVLMEERRACRRLSDLIETLAIKDIDQTETGLEIDHDHRIETREIEINGQKLLEIRVEEVVAGKTISFERWVEP